MAVYRYPPEVHEFVKKYCVMLRDEELAEACNRELGTDFTTKRMRAFRGNHVYRNKKKQWSSEEYWKYQKRWPAGMFEYIKENSWGVSNAEMAQKVNEKFGTNFTKHRMQSFRAKYKIRSGCTGWYQKGHAPGNKGKKLEEYVTDPERLAYVRERISVGCFKPGNVPANLRQVGDITTASDGYLLRKKQMTGTQWERWEYLHRAVWEEHNGPIPEGMVVMFKDGDKTNCDISNLMLAKRVEMSVMTRKGYVFEDPDLTETALSMVRLKLTAGKMRKQKKEGKNDENTNSQTGQTS